MLKVLEDGVEITLNGKDKNPLFLFSSVLVICAILVAVIAMVAPVEMTLLAFFGLACLILGFNIYKNKLSKQMLISTGVLTIKNQELQFLGRKILLSKNAQIIMLDESLTVMDLDKTWVFSGFDSQKELEVAHCVLQGKMLQKQAKSIRLNDTK